ncbi:MAG TPA: EamA family transporter, partial [Alphaproteobacteria bacterium]|nr:EamA family transporter [Alphaproteobacteria bacterium]
WRRWLAIMVGLSGVLLIIRPGMAGFSIYSLWALGAVAAVTLREILTRQLSHDVPSLPVALATAVAICGLGAVTLPGVQWVAIDPFMWVYITGAGVAVIGGYLFSVMAVRTGDLGFVSPFRYTSMIWAISLGFLLFGDLPDLPTTIGTAIIIVTGLYSLHRERRRAAETAQATD